jgi:hypothetical protein
LHSVLNSGQDTSIAVHVLLCPFPSGLDAHSAWSLPGMRRLMLNGVLWTAGKEIPAEGAPCEIEEDKLLAMQTPREPKPKPAKTKKK